MRLHDSLRVKERHTMTGRRLYEDELDGQRDLVTKHVNNIKKRETHKEFTKKQMEMCQKYDKISPELYEQYDVKKGLRDKNGKGVLTGLTNISRVDGFENINGVRTPCEGRLWYRGYDVLELTKGLSGRRFGFEEATFLLLFGDLPTEEQFEEFREVLNENMVLPTTFTRDVIMKAQNKDIMNSITKSVLSLAAYDSHISDNSISNIMSQCISLISVFPMLAVYAYQAYVYYYKDEGFLIHRPDPNLSTAENILRMLRPDSKYTELEAQVLDIALILHMEHGGGNNSTFTTRVVTSAGSDTYAVVAAALSSLKGPKHGGANIKVVQMMKDIKENLKNPDDEEELREYLLKILDKKAFDKQGLIYGMGHAVYSLSDPRATIFKMFTEKLAIEKGREADFKLYSNIERIAPELITSRKNAFTGVSANVDFYSGFVYSMLEIPEELFTPLFAVARIVGWSAHRVEELINSGKIIRPAYQSVMPKRDYVPIEKRE